ncbi:primosomal protein N' [Cohnella sp. CFH 77786]|uniref:primosomal protein N' n=1 Tax=Cohnella sp. CFH 77786 TaxID=2662265 RepID=UPI001EB780EF|nr:primosomal protein N' [Cohnella sp. CFH 77786]MBW5444673.1 primosomal protein N' [Cohnella sp. CFH 77786]
MMIARVIVDVPTRETDRPFDYEVPERLAAWTEAGSRVAVPFAGRTLQGFVTGFAEEAEVERGRLKPIADVLDALPPLTPELVELGAWMSRRWVCPLVVALQAMLPAALKGRMEKYIAPAEGAEAPADQTGAEASVWQAFRRGSAVKWSALMQQFPDSGPLLKRWLKEGRLTERQQVEDRLSVKTVATVFPPDADKLRELLAHFPAGARKQKEVLAYLAERPEPVALAELSESAGVSAQVIRALGEKGALEIRQVTEDRDPYQGRDFPVSAPLPLTPAQRAALDPIAESLSERRHRVFLLHGVTGSGKTEIYLQAIQQCLEQGREAIVLVPEIALTPQMVERFKSRFGARVAVLHSRLSQGERYDEWRKIREGRAQVAVGARSAVFAPFSRIGLIVIDEEHETSYKQEESPKYHARDVAAERARMNGAVVVLGSATPSLESFAAAAEGGGYAGDIQYVRLPERVADRPLPDVRIVDMREELKLGNRAMFSRALKEALEERLRREEQAVLLLNRRGYSTFVMCRSCGYTCSCPHCDIALTYHRGSRNLRCHYCGYAEGEPESCPACQSPHIRFFGTGTQKVEEALAETFPGIRVIRMDVDTTSEKGSHEKWLTMFRERKADVLLGTQMVAKGLDFPRVTLVGVLAADAALRLPDFRAAERTFQLLTQVAGRAGRHELPGEVVIQTYDPEHVSVASVAGHDYVGFVRQELETRRLLGYPPYGRLISVTFSHESVPMLLSTGEMFARKMRQRAEALGIASVTLPGEAAGMDVLGPVPSPIPRLKDRYRFQCMVKYRGKLDAGALTAEVLREMGEAPKRGGVQISVDVDPQMML